MNEDEIIAIIRSRARLMEPVEIADLLARLTGGDLSQGMIVTYFKRAFPVIPLNVLLEASGWIRVSKDGLSDQGFNELLRPWLQQQN